MNILKRLFCRHDYKFVRNIEWKRSLWMCPKCGSFQYRNEIKCDGCNNVRGCINCKDGSEWAHYEEPVSEDLEEAAWLYYDKNKPLIPKELDLHREFVSFFKAGAQWQKERLIDKACEWLEDNVFSTEQLDRNYSSKFRKAMEV